MDYSVILSEISSKQVEILSSLKGIQNGLDCLILIFVVFALCFYLRLIVKH